MKIPAIALAVLLASLSTANAQELAGRILDESGAPISGATVTIAGVSVPADTAGNFKLEVTGPSPAVLRFSAPDHYDAVQAFAADDDVGDITLVARAENRRMLVFAGDAMLARRYFEPRAEEPVLVHKGQELEDGKQVLGTIRPYIELADFASVNLETQLSAKEPEERLPKSVTFYSPPELAKVLEWTGFDYVALGNNHTWDYRAGGLRTTFDALDDTNLGYSGAGFDEQQARAAFTTDLNGKDISLLSYNGWAGTFSPTQTAAGSKGGAALGGDDVFAEDLATIDAEALSVVQYHSGLEYAEAPAMSERQRLRHAVDHGADVAIGHHAHVLQGLEIYRGRLIAYSMGNFLFDQYIYTTQLGMLLYVWMDGETLHRAEVVPMHVNGYVPTPATGSMRYSILHRLARLSRPLGTCLRENGAHAVVSLCNTDDTQSVDLAGMSPGNVPVHAKSIQASPTSPLSFESPNHQYRLGTDILRRGNFESAGRFGTVDRGWIEYKNAQIVELESKQLQVIVDGSSVRTGMKVFDRVFAPSNPTTLSGRIYVDGPATVRFYHQRRRIDDSFSEALESGPMTSVGGVRLNTPGWHYFTIDFDQPRLSTRAVRLLFNVSNDEPSQTPREVRFDDLSWVEWRTPWLSSGEADFGSHVQFRPSP